MDESQDPLISRNPEDEEQDEVVTQAAHQTSKGQSAGPGIFIVLLTTAAGISGLLFGYDTGVISATLVSIGTSLSNRALDSFDKSIITSSTALFALLISPFSSVLADSFGRKRVILFADILFIVGALIQAYCRTVQQMVIGRCVIGAGVGAASFVVPLYLAEVAPTAFRGRLVTTNVMFITLGQAVAYIIGWLFATYGSKETGWRWMVGLGALPAFFQAAMTLFMPETPRWLVKAGDADAALRVVQRVNGSGVSSREAEAVIKDIEMEIREEEAARRASSGQMQSARWQWTGPWRDLVTEGKNRRALAIACLLQGLQQLCGFNSLMYFSATIFAMVGFSNPTLTSLTVAIANFIFTIIALGLIDRIGRRRMLLYSIPFMIVGLLLAALGFSFLTMDASSVETRVTDTNHFSAAMLILVSIMVYVSSYSLGLGNVPWMQSELFPLAVRSLGSGVATATNWSANFVIGLTFLPLVDFLGPSWTFTLYAMLCGAGLGLVFRIYPETAGLSLEEARALLENGWGVR